MGHGDGKNAIARWRAAEVEVMNANYSFIHVVSAWANKAWIVLGQMRVDEKSNEITAVPQLLDLFKVENCVFTSDAMSCQKKTVEQIMS